VMPRSAFSARLVEILRG